MAGDDLLLVNGLYPAIDVVAAALLAALLAAVHRLTERADPPRRPAALWLVLLGPAAAFATLAAGSSLPRAVILLAVVAVLRPRASISGTRDAAFAAAAAGAGVACGAENLVLAAAGTGAFALVAGAAGLLGRRS